MHPAKTKNQAEDYRQRRLQSEALELSFFHKLEFVPFRFIKAVAKLWLIKTPLLKSVKHKARTVRF